MPYTIRIGGTAYEDHEQLDTVALLDAMDSCPQIDSTVCSPPHTWAEEFKKAENTISVTISDNLSDSYNSASGAKQLVLSEEPHRKISVLDSVSASPAIALLIRHITEMIKKICLLKPSMPKRGGIIIAFL